MVIQKRKNWALPSLIFSVIIFSHGACVNHDLDGPVIVSCTDSKAISFESDVRPIINNNCAFSGCHNGDLGEDLKWTVLKNFQDHAAEVKRRITLPLSDSDKMPRVGKLTYDQIEIIVCWVEQGAKDN
jgi:hypothetical protein